jgi:SAM-dependent methyltransferase
MPEMSPHRPKGPMQSLFPECVFTSFYRAQAPFVFYSAVADLVKPEYTLIDFGSGRGEMFEWAWGHLRYLVTFKGRCRRVIAVDVSDAVLQHPFADERYRLDSEGKTPLPDTCADIIVSYAVLEHVANPDAFGREITRLLKPGGWFCAWTPNKWGYIAIGSKLVSERLQERVLSSAQPNLRKAGDVFPTTYRMNTLGDIRRIFDASRFDSFSFGYSGDPTYNFGSTLMARLLRVMMALSPGFMSQSLMVFERKRDAPMPQAPAT